MRSRFDEQLSTLKRELIEMGALCEDAITAASDALVAGDAALAKKVAPLSEEIERRERDIEGLCLKLLLLQQPVARDLRQVSAALKMVTDMERIGDQAEDIAEIIGFLSGRTCGDCAPIGEMAKAAGGMVTESVNAYVRQDVALARAVIDSDDVVDGLFDRVKTSLIGLIAANPGDGKYAVDLLMIAKHFERMADHAVNIGHWVIFSITGVHKGTEEL